MTTAEHEDADEQQRFERMLLDSAVSDVMPRAATEAAWQRFSGLMAAVVVSGASTGVPSASASGWMRVLRSSAGKYLMLGALGGSALTLVYLGGAGSQRAHSTASVLPSGGAPRPARPSAEESADAARPRTSAAPLLDAPAPQLAGRHAQRAPKPRSARASERVSSAAPSAPPAQSPKPSTLAAELGALDAARAATRAGAYQVALNLLEQYRNDFPHGALRADVDVASIEALYAQGNRREALQRAARFLAESPNDPHSAMVRRLVDR